MLDGNLKKFLRVHNFFIKTIKALRLVLPCYWGIDVLINMLDTNKGHNDRLLQPKCLFSLAAIFILGKTKKGELESCTRSPSLMDHIIHRAVVKIPSDLTCIIESIRDMSVDIQFSGQLGLQR